MTYFFTALGLVALVVYIFLRCKHKLFSGLIIKCVVSLLFLITATSAAFSVSAEKLSSFKALFGFIILGLITGLLGDIFLDMKDMYKQDKDKLIFCGFVAFLIGHLFFFFGIIKSYDFVAKNLLIAFVPAIIIVVANLGLEKKMGLNYGKYKGIVAVYSFVMVATIAYGLLAAFHEGTAPQGAAVFLLGSKNVLVQPFIYGVGGVAFILSDLILSQTYFGKNHEKSFDYILNYALYYGAQFTIAISLMFV